MASPDEAAAMKRNLVHQTRLQLALKQLDRDRTVRLREIDKDTQVFLHRLGDPRLKRSSLPNLPGLHGGPEGRIGSAPAKRFSTRHEISRTRSQMSHREPTQLGVTRPTTCWTTGTSLCPTTHSPSTASVTLRDKEKLASRDHLTSSAKRTDKVECKEVRFDSSSGNLQGNKFGDQGHRRPGVSSSSTERHFVTGTSQHLKPRRRHSDQI